MSHTVPPRERPAGRNAGTQRWSELLFVHYELLESELQPLLPPGLEVDSFEGRTFVGLVPFRMERIAPAFVPGALGLNFLETNLRVYVRHAQRGPGVYFFSLEASSRLAVRIARRFWGLPYFDADMSVVGSAQDERDYHSQRRGHSAELHARFRTGARLGPAEVGTLDEFLLERYVLYALRDGVLSAGVVHHPPYERTEVELLAFEETLTRAAGLRPLGVEPCAVHASPGVDVEVFALRPVE